jgi:uncharacterized protein
MAAGGGRSERPWWTKPRGRSAVVLAILGLAAGFSRVYAHLQIDQLWFEELGQERVFWTVLASRWLAAGLAGLATTMFLLGNFWIVERVAPRPVRLPRRQAATARLRYAVLSAYLAVSAGAGLLVARSVVVTDWQQLLLWFHRRDFGIVDPIFHRDVGFFVFSLPLYQKVAHWLFVTMAAALFCAVVGHIATGAIRMKPAPISATRWAHAHVLVLGALLLLVLAWQHWLDQFALELPRGGATLPGAAYTDIHAQLPWLRVLMLATGAGAVMLVVAAVRRSWSLPAVVLVAVIVAELVNPSVLPSAIQRFIVDPQTLSRERPYLAHSLEFTRLAYGLDRVAERRLPAHATISTQELRSNRDVLRNIPLWDSNVLKPEIDQQQSIGSYYSFPNVTVDRYRQGRRTRAVIVAPRELDLDRLEQSGRTWANDRLAYTHGYGLVAVPAGGVDDEGKPTFLTSEFGVGRAPIRARQRRIYYGVQAPEAQPWVVVRSERAEIEKPLSGGAPESEYHYDGDGGIPMSGLLRRGLFALRFGDLNLALSQTVGDEARLVLRRDVHDRLDALAPFLRWEEPPEAAVVDGRVVYLAHGYATSDSFPYSAQVEVDGAKVNYMREPVVAAVDAFDGRVTIYATGEGDPILDAWQAAFPTLFTPMSRMPATLRAHLRYPQELFEAQSRIWATYHTRDVDDFYTKADAWQQPSDVSGPVQHVGTLSNRFKSGAPKMGPSFLLARLPGDREQRFMLTTPFTAYSQENMSGYLTGRIDAGGRARLTQLSLSRSRLVLGPAQVSRQILATPAVSDRLRLLNQETTDLGDRAVNTVELGEPRVVPIGDSFLYVQPIYVTSQGTGVTRLRLVTVYLNGRVGYGKSLDEAIRRAQEAPDVP